MRNTDKLANVVHRWLNFILPIVSLIIIIFLYNILSEFRIFSIVFNTLLPFVLSFLLAWILNPVVTAIERKTKIPRTIISVVIMLTVLLVISGIFILVLPVLYSQIRSVAYYLADLDDEAITFLRNLNERLPFQINVESSNDLFKDISEQISVYLLNFVDHGADVVFQTLSILGVFVKVVIITLMIFTVSVYILIDFNNSREKFYSLIPSKYLSDVKYLIRKSNLVIVGYIRGIILETIIMFILSYIAFAILGIEGALVFAVIVGITNIVPYIGPYIGAIPVGVYALIDSPRLFITVSIFILILQQFDSLILKPKIFGKTNAIHPAITVIAFILFAQLYGFVGILFAIPITGLVIVITKFIYEKLVEKYPYILK